MSKGQSCPLNCAVAGHCRGRAYGWAGRTLAAMRALLLGVVLLAACDDGAQSVERSRLRAEREAKAQAFAAQPLALVKHDLAGGQLLVLDIPLARDGIKERQTCFVWRDEALKSAAFTCPTREVYLGQ